MTKTLMKNLILLLTASLSMAALANDPSNDSTNMPIPNTKNVQAQTIITNQCIAASRIQAVAGGFGTSTSGTKTSECPTGYTATGIQADVSIGLNLGYYRWESYCCKAYVGYQN